jgi:hypothetical protein
MINRVNQQIRQHSLKLKGIAIAPERSPKV